VRKISGYGRPSRVNESADVPAAAEIAAAGRRMFETMAEARAANS
jgi:hypothetical protein